ncbi:hypothetical protein I3843_08G121100 [Carya illinoinensis]|nr:hypothetical protein I3843_08G121100 [Carya illinoinensis]
MPARTKPNMVVMNLKFKAKFLEKPVKKSRGGCGAQQPKLTIKGLKLIAEYRTQRKQNDDQASPSPTCVKKTDTYCREGNSLSVQNISPHSEVIAA